MASRRILQLNALSTAACALGMLATREVLHPLFGLDTASLLDIIAVGFLAYAGAVALAARRGPSREALLAFAAADAAWVLGSVVVLLLFWPQFAAVARVLVIAVAVVVEVFAALQFRAAGGFGRRSPGIA